MYTPLILSLIHIWLERRRDRQVAAHGQQDGVAIGRGLGDQAGGDVAARARPVLDDHGLPQGLAHGGGDQAAIEVAAAARRKADHQGDGTLGKCRLRLAAGQREPS